MLYFMHFYLCSSYALCLEYISCLICFSKSYWYFQI